MDEGEEYGPIQPNALIEGDGYEYKIEATHDDEEDDKNHVNKSHVGGSSRDEKRRSSDRHHRSHRSRSRDRKKSSRRSRSRSPRDKNRRSDRGDKRSRDRSRDRNTRDSRDRDRENRRTSRDRRIRDEKSPPSGVSAAEKLAMDERLKELYSRQQRQRSDSPTPMAPEGPLVPNFNRRPTRRKKSSIYWDIPPTGFEHISPYQYKQMQAAGQLPATLFAPVSAASAVPVAPVPLVGSTITRQARRLYVGNIPFGCSEEEMMDFFNSQMHACGFAQAAGNPILACQINLDKNFSFLEVSLTIAVEDTAWHVAVIDNFWRSFCFLELYSLLDYLFWVSWLHFFI